MTDSDIDYEELGFRCGIEIHQQLDTESKLFCDCPVHEGERPAAQVLRRLRPVASELGEVDQAAQYEYLKGQEFTYNIYPEVSCLVELDEEPPHPVDREALDIALEAALLMDCTVPDEIHFMRKTVIDGSNTAGFQRTAIVGLDGSIETEQGAVAIEDMELEEDSAGIHSRDRDAAVYDLDRLGVPLIEVGTDASIQDPAHAKAVAERIGMLLRSTGKVKRGLGTIRQDVNVSIERGSRVEIKGFQELALLDDLVRNEVVRQRSLVALMDSLEGPVAGEVHDVTEVFADAGNDIIDRILTSDGVVLAFKLAGLAGKMGDDLCPGLHLGKELANYAAAHGTKGMIHSDEDLERYGLTEPFAELEDELDADGDDVVCIIAEHPDTAEPAAEAVRERADLLPEQVPEETRIAEETITRYARPLPGEARMYPETDIPPIGMAQEDIEAVQDDLPEPLDEKEERYAAEVGDELAAQLIRTGRHLLFDRLREEHDVDAAVLANICTNVFGELESVGVDVDGLDSDRVSAAVGLLADGTVTKNQVGDLLALAAEEPGVPVAELAETFDQVGEDEVRDVVREVISEKEELIAEQGEHARGALMGLVMERLDGADGSLVNRVLTEELEERL